MNIQDYDDAIIIQEIPSKQAIIFLPFFFPFAFFAFLLMYMGRDNDLFFIWTLMSFFLCICLCVFIKEFIFRKRTFLISNTVIIYELKNRKFFEIKWDHFYRIKLKTVYLSARVSHIPLKFIDYQLLFFLPENKIKKVNLSFSEKKMLDIIENLKAFCIKKNKEFLSEVAYGIQNLKSEN